MCFLGHLDGNGTKTVAERRRIRFTSFAVSHSFAVGAFHWMGHPMSTNSAAVTIAVLSLSQILHQLKFLSPMLGSEAQRCQS